MKSLTYDNTLNMLSFCREVSSETAEWSEEEKETLVKRYIDNGGLTDKVSLDVKDLSGKDIPVEKKLIVSSAYMTSIVGSILHYMSYLARVKAAFSPLSWICDAKGRNFQQANSMVIRILKMSDGDITDKEIADLAGYIHEMPKRRFDFWVRLVCGIIIYLDVTIALLASIVFMTIH